MRTVMVVAAIALGGCELEPGETRCTTTNVYGTMVTNCKTGEPRRAPAPVVAAPRQPREPTVFWCATRVSDGFGYCATQPGHCEDLRGTQFGACNYREYAICASSGCFTTPESCAKVERLAKRSAAACVLRR